MRWSPNRQRLALLTAGWTIGALAAWLLLARIGWVGVLLVGIALLAIAAWWALDEANAAPSYTGGNSAVYTAQYERQFGPASPEQRASRRAEAQRFNRMLYLFRTVAWALLLIGVYGVVTRIVLWPDH